MTVELRRVMTCQLRRADHAITQPVFKVGGCPVLFEEADWPVCDDCETEMDFVAQIPLQAPLPLARQYAMAYIFMCPSPSGCATWDAWSGCNRVLLQEKADSTTLGTRSEGSDFGAYPDYEASLLVAEEPVVDTADFDTPSSLRDQVSDATKIGGVPSWIQSNETPTCPACGGPVSFIAQLTADLEGSQSYDRSLEDRRVSLEFGDCGLGYIFICSDECCEEGAAFLWQCS